MLKIPYSSIRKTYRSSLFSVLPYSLSLAMLYVLIEPKTKPTFTDTTDWMALSLFILGLLGVFILHACIVHQIANAIKYNNAEITREDSEDSNSVFTVLGFGFKKMIPVMFMSLYYVILVALGLVALVVPGIFLFIVGSLSLFIIVLKDTNPIRAFIESYRLVTPHWISVGATMLGLLILFSMVEMIADWILTEQVVFAILFSVIIRGFLWPIAYVTMMTLLIEFSNAKATATAKLVAESQQNSESSKSSRRKRKLASGEI